MPPASGGATSRASASAAPLAGVRIISVEQYGAGPFGTLYLADMGAEVIKIEDPAVGGDVSRYIPPGQQETDSLFFETFNRGKRSLVLDLKTAAGREIFERLVATADAVYNNLRGDQPTRLGLTYERLGSINPRIVCASLTGYGRTGTRASLPGYDALIQAEAGWAALTGDPDGPPVKSGLSLADYAAGLTSALALMIGLFDAQRTGLGRDVDANLYDVALAMLSYPATWFLSAGLETERHPGSAHPSVVPFQFFQTADGHLALACPKEKFFRSLARVIGLPELVDDERFGSFDARRVHRQELVRILEARFRERSTADWLNSLRGVVPVAPVRSLREALDEDELDDRAMLAAYPHPTLGDVRAVGTPFTVAGHEPAYRAGPGYGADREELLTAIGYSAGEIGALEANGAFGAKGVTSGSEGEPAAAEPG